jgi:hypothetical protein
VEHYYQPPLRAGARGARLSACSRLAPPIQDARQLLCDAVHRRALAAVLRRVGRPKRPPTRAVGIAARTATSRLCTLAGFIGKRSTTAWLDTCERLDIPAGYARLEDLENDPHLAATGFFRTLHDDASGAVRFPGPGVRVDGRPLDPKMPPRLGEHTCAVLREAGLPDDRIEALAAPRVARDTQRTTKEIAA